MDMKTIIICPIAVMVVSLACASIYAGEAGDASHIDTHNDHDGIQIKGCSNVKDIMGTCGIAHEPHVVKIALDS